MTIRHFLRGVVVAGLILAGLPVWGQAEAPAWLKPIEGLPKLLEEKKFGELDQNLRWYAEHNPYDDMNLPLMKKVYEAFPYRANWLPLLDEWCKTQPKSGFAFTIRGKMKIDHAWAARGTGFIHTIGEESRKNFDLRMAAARSDLAQAAALAPNDVFVWTNMLHVARGLGLPEAQMEEYFQRGIKADPRSVLPYQQKLEYLKPRWHGSVAKMFEFARECSRIGTKDLRTSTVLLQAHIEMAEDYNSGRAHWGRMGVWGEVERCYRNLIAASPNPVPTRAWFLRHSIMAGEWEDADEQLEAVGPEFHGAFKNIGEYLHLRAWLRNRKWASYQKEDCQWLVDACTRRIEKEPNKALYYGVRGQARRFLFQYAEAMADWEKALAIDPSQTEWRIQIANTYSDFMQQYEQSLEHYRKARIVRPYDDDLAIKLLKALYMAEHDDEAKKLLNEVIASQPDDKEPFKIFVDRYHIKKDYKGGQAFANEYIKKVDPVYKVPHIYLLNARGVFAENLGDPEATIRDHEAALKINPNDEWTLSHYALLLSDPKYPKLQNKEKAIELGRRGVRNAARGDGWPMLLLGQVYENFGMPEEAKGVYRRAVRMDSRNTVAKDRLAALEATAGAAGGGAK